MRWFLANDTHFLQKLDVLQYIGYRSNPEVVLAQFFGKFSAFESAIFLIFLKEFMFRWISTRWFLANDTYFFQKHDVLQHIDYRSNPELVLAQFFGKISALESACFLIF